LSMGQLVLNESSTWCQSQRNKISSKSIFNYFQNVFLFLDHDEILKFSKVLTEIQRAAFNIQTMPNSFASKIMQFKDTWLKDFLQTTVCSVLFLQFSQAKKDQ
jgi:hypothetical protein